MLKDIFIITSILIIFLLVIMLCVKIDEQATDLYILYLYHSRTVDEVDAIQDKLRSYFFWINFHDFYEHKYTKDKERHLRLEIPDRFVRGTAHF